MANEKCSTNSQSTSIKSDAFDYSDELDLLKIEYEALRSEIRMYIEQYSPKFTIFGVFVLSAFTFAFKNPKYQIIYLIIPLFIFVIGYVTITQAYLITLCAARIRSIERRIAELNQRIPLLLWEHKICMKMVYPLILRLYLKGEGNKRIMMLNPIFICVISIIFAVLPLLAYCIWKSYLFFPSPWNILYTSFLALVSLGILIQSISFFRMGRLTDQIDYEM